MEDEVLEVTQGQRACIGAYVTSRAFAGGKGQLGEVGERDRERQRERQTPQDELAGGSS